MPLPSLVWIEIGLFINCLVAFMLGALVGYERSYHGRAAGMRTYGLVCMASAALVSLVGHPSLWYAHSSLAAVLPDPTRVIQGIVTGIGFLGAGVIMKEGLNISGLTTAASIWASSAIGILMGINFYLAAFLLALLAASCMMWMGKIENMLPTRHAIDIFMTFEIGHAPNEAKIQAFILGHGYAMAPNSLKIDAKPEGLTWHFVALSLGKKKSDRLPELAEALNDFTGVREFHLSFARN